jgi:hypothetical protein
VPGRHRSAAGIAAVLWAVLAAGAWAAEDTGLFAATRPPGTLWVDVGADTTNVLDARIELDVPAGERTLLRLGTGGTYIPTPSANVDAGYILFGAQVDAAPGVSAGASYEFWGQQDIVTTHTVAGSFTWRGDAVSLSVLPQARRIVLYRQLVRTGVASAETTGRGLDLLGTLYGPGGWEWTAGATAWNYEGSADTLRVRALDTRALDVRVVDVRVAIARVTTQVLPGPAAGFVERRLSGEAAYRFGAARVGAEGSVTRYVADDRPTYGAALRVYLPAGRRRALELRGGRLFGGDLGPVTYGRVAVGYSW